VLSLLTLIVLSATLFVYRRQAGIMETQAAIMGTQAAIMDKQRDISEKLMESDVADVELESEECSTAAFGLDTYLTLHYRNFGRTRADTVRQTFTPGLLEGNEPPPAPDYDMSRATTLSANESMPSGTTATIREMLQAGISHHVISDATPEAAIERIRAGKLRFGFWGRVRFDDTLGTAHENSFVYEWDRALSSQCIFTQVTQRAETRKKSK
jgi:hypothetical protein